MALDVEARGPAWELLRGRHRDPPGSALALRLMGAVHRLVLEGHLPALARFYPTAGGSADAHTAWPHFRAALGEHREELVRRLDDPVQTNEVGRSRALLGGFLLAARATGLPLRVLEIGASGGLNLNFDRYHYESAGWAFGAASSPVRFEEVFAGEAPPLDVRLEVAERRGCDERPCDPASEEGRLTLLTYVWPDQEERVRALEGALEVARRHPPPVDRQGAADWLAELLARSAAGSATVVFHSIVMQYLAAPERARVDELIDQAGRAAAPDRPMARLAMEPAPEMADVTLTLWPEGTQRVVAKAGYHGRPVRWLG